MSATTSTSTAAGSTSRRPYILRRNSPPHIALLVAGGVVALALILWGGGLAPFEQGQMIRVMIYAIAIAGLNIATGYTGMISVGHSAFFGLGAYTTGVLVVQYGWQATYTLPIAFVICFVVGLVVGLPALRIRGLYFAMVTLAFGVAFPEVINHFPDLTGGPSGLTIRRAMLRPPEWTGFTLGQKDVYLYWLCVVVLILMMLLIRNLVRSRYGLALLSTRDNEIAAASSGINLAVVKTVSFGVSGAVTGVAGGLFAMYLGSLVAGDSFTLLAAIALLTGLMIGGQATILGPIVGGLVVVFLPYYTSDLGQGQISGVLFGAALIIIIFVMPQGIYGGILQLLQKVFRILPGVPPAPAPKDQPPAGPTSGDPLPAETTSTPDVPGRQEGP